MNISRVATVLLALSFLAVSACDLMHTGEKEQSHEGHQKLVTTSPLVKDVVTTQQYVCQIRSQRNIEVRAIQEGYLDEIPVKEGQMVKAGEVLFRVVPTLYRAKRDAEVAEANLAQLELNNTKKLFDQRLVSDREVALFEAKLAKAKAKAAQAEAELNFTEVKAPYDGILDRLLQQQGSLVKKEDLLTTLSDNSVMWVYFNVPEVRYLEYKARQGQVGGARDLQHLQLADSRIELVLADGSKFGHDAGDTVTVEGKFNNETGNIAFRADFPNADGLLRHGQTGNVLIHRTVHNAVVIPQRATFEILDRRYVYVIDKGGVARQREILVQHEMEDVFVIAKGLDVNERIVLEGVRQVRDGETRECEFRKPEEALANQKNHAE